MLKDMTVLKGISTLRSVRKLRLDPVPDDCLQTVLEAASKAASGSNTQPWEFVVVRDPKQKRRLKDSMLSTWLQRLSNGSMSERMRLVYDGATEMLRNTEKGPS